MNGFGDCECSYCRAQIRVAADDFRTFGTAVLKRESNGHVNRVDPTKISFREEKERQP